MASPLREQSRIGAQKRLATFLFSLKFPRAITHVKMLKNAEEEAASFIRRVYSLGNKLGPLLLQLPPAFKPKHLQLLGDFISSLPGGCRLAVEVREEKLLDESLYSMLRENGVALVVVDQPNMPEQDMRTAGFTYVRWEGNRRDVKGTIGTVEIDRSPDLKRWAEKIKRLSDGSVEVFGYFSKYYSGSPTSDASQLMELLKR